MSRINQQKQTLKKNTSGYLKKQATIAAMILSLLANTPNFAQKKPVNAQKKSNTSIQKKSTSKQTEKIEKPAEKPRPDQEKINDFVNTYENMKTTNQTEIFNKNFPYLVYRKEQKMGDKASQILQVEFNDKTYIFAYWPEEGRLIIKIAGYDFRAYASEKKEDGTYTITDNINKAIEIDRGKAEKEEKEFIPITDVALSIKQQKEIIAEADEGSIIFISPRKILSDIKKYTQPTTP